VFSLASNWATVPPLPVMTRPLFTTLPLIQLWTAEVTSTVTYVPAADTGTALATTPPIAG
jgi:hypothetical protein